MCFMRLPNDSNGMFRHLLKQNRSRAGSLRARRPKAAVVLTPESPLQSAKNLTSFRKVHKRRFVFRIMLESAQARAHNQPEPNRTDNSAIAGADRRGQGWAATVRSMI
jgi:hypothetical protein